MTEAPRPPDDVLAYYALGGERTRLDTGAGVLELARTQELLARWLPAGACIADVGGADGRYAEWLVDRGYSVELVEPVETHLLQARARAGSPPRFGVRAGDARRLPLDESSFDAVLLLGPLYHLPSRADRLAALSEAARVSRRGGLVVAAAISRFAPVLDAVSRGNLLDENLLRNVVRETAAGRRVEPSSRTAPFPDACFHRPEELAGEISEAGLELVAVTGVQGPGWLRLAADPASAEPALVERLAALARELEHEPQAAILSAHLLALARRPL